MGGEQLAQDDAAEGRAHRVRALDAQSEQPSHHADSR
jgi:hypothetical protein